MHSGSFIAAFVAGLVSFVSPCVIPLVPAYLSFLTGLKPGELKENRSLSLVLAPALLFVLGFTVVFVALGASASALGALVSGHQRLVAVIGGLLVIVFGVLMTGVVKVPWLYQEARVDLGRTKRFGSFSGFFMGMAFAAGWTPCIGPMLGSILALASRVGTARAGVILLLVYSAGLAIPFILVALFFGSFAPYWRFVSKYGAWVNRIAGLLLIAVGVLLVSGVFGKAVGLLGSIGS